MEWIDGWIEEWYYTVSSCLSASFLPTSLLLQSSVLLVLPSLLEAVRPGTTRGIFLGLGGEVVLEGWTAGWFGLGWVER